MMKFTLMFSAGAMSLSLLAFASPDYGSDLDPDKALHEWRMQRLLAPSPRDLEKEREGSVYIYEGLTEQEVDTALETQFPRIQNMMFVGTVKSDEHGKPMQDPTGQLIQQSGGCGE